jgi:subtilisin family serine protease
LIELVRVLAVVLCLVPLSVAVAAPAASEEKAVYIVRLEGVPLARSQGASAEGLRKLDLASVSSLRSQESLRVRQDEALAAIGGALGRDVEPLHRYSVAFYGMALELTAKEAATLAKVPGIRQVQPAVKYHPSSDAGPAWTGAPGIWNATSTGGLPGTKGEGIIIGVVDTGISLGHPSFADVGGDSYNHVNPRGSGNYVGWCSPSNPDYDPSLACNDKLIGVWSFPGTGDDPRDDDGHGTHVASIAAGNHLNITVPGTLLTRQISGVAPHANLISYDACSSYNCYSYDLLAAVEQALIDGVDVLNLSVAGYTNWTWQSSLGDALLTARAAGVFVTAALSDYYDEVGSPGNAPWVLATGASTHNRGFASSLVGVSGGATLPPTLPGIGLTTSYGPVSIVQASHYGSYFCSYPFAPGTFNGQLVACASSYSQSEVQGQNVLAGGAGGIVLAEYDSYGSFGEPAANVLPSIRLQSDAGSKLWDWLTAGSGHTARITGTTADLNASRADRLWPGSPQGLDYYSFDILKPDVTAPGQEILAAHIDAGGYKVLSGTSMAAAHAAGGAALLMDLHPGWTLAEIQSALQTTAVPVTQVNGSATTPLQAGSGRLDLSAAARAGLVLPVTTAQYEAADPWLDGDPKNLNLPTLTDSYCDLTCTWPRLVKSTLSTTSHWTVSVETPAGVSLTVTPSSFTLGPGGSQSLQIIASGTKELSNWSFGRIVITESSAQAPAARLPVAIFWTPYYELTVQKAGSGAGAVTSNPTGLNCGSDCSELYREDIYVTLTATPSPGSVFVGWSGGDCYGTSLTCSASMYRTRNETAWFNPPSPDKPLSNQVPLKDSINGPVYNGTWNYYYVDLGSGNGELVVDVLDLTGEANLYVAHGEKPTGWGNADCIDVYSYYGTNNRRCVFVSPAAGRWWIGVNNGVGDVTIRYSVRASWGAATDRELANRSPLSDFLNAQSSGATWKYYFVDLPAGSSNLAVELSRLSADADLYIRFGAKPDRTNNDCASSEGSTVPDGCNFPNPAAGRWWIGVNNFSTGTIAYLLKASWQTIDTPTDFYSVAPCRILDTRTGAQPLLSGVSRTIQVTGLCGIPSTAKAIAANVTIVGGTGPGYLVLYPGDEGIPSTGTLNFAASQTRSNNVLLKLDGSGVGNLGALATVTGAGQVHMIVDVNGYFE